MPVDEGLLEKITKSKRKMQVLKHLKRVGSDYNQKMALKFDISPGSFITHLERLEKYGLITHFSKDNERDVHYKLTAAGNAFLQTGESE
jgi:DNA-binding MarR family transcriptional regulator